MFRQTEDLAASLKTLRDVAKEQGVGLNSLVAVVLIDELKEIEAAIRENTAAIQDRGQTSHEMFRGLMDTIGDALGGRPDPGTDQIEGLAGIVGAHAQAIDNIVNTLQDHARAIAAISPELYK